MKTRLFTLIFTGFSLGLTAQTQIPNGGFENWGNTSPGNADEPTSWYSNKTGSTVASIGPQTCYKETSNPHSGSFCARLETKYYVLAVVNGNLTTGVVNAPSQDKSEGYVGTVNYSSASDVRRMPFIGRPDSLVGWYRYTQATNGTGASAEKAKVVAFLHTGDYNDPEIPVNGNHPDLSANKIGKALFNSAAANNTTWKRFSVPFVYTSGDTPEYIMISITPSDNQMTTAPTILGTGSILWIDDLEVIYNPDNASVVENEQNNFNVYNFENKIFVDLSAKNDKLATLKILDISGKVVMETKLTSNQKNEITLSAELVQGTYFYQVSGSELQKTGKFVIK
jgi:hypothetical protein